MPVTSLKDSLTSYTEIRKDKSTEPIKKTYPDKPGTVLRSWAIPKHKIPTTKSLLATETEDHDINYKNFEGTIPEGNYGAGTVEIYDEGKFELVDVVYDKKYVIKFNGKKIKGYNALIKTTNKNFLWIKVKNVEQYKKSSMSELVVSCIMRENGNYKCSH
jgi:bifunctional non-homologous end joining protein LigD